MVARAVRGQDIATRLRIERRESESGALWSVPSQSGRGVYTVDFRGKTPACTCPDYELSGVKCKHIYAVEYTVRAEAARDMGVPFDESPLCPPKRPTYRQDWPAYNAAQTHEKAHFQEFLSALCRDIPDLPRQPGPGRARLPLRDMVFASCFKVYSTVSCRRFMSDLADAHAKGYLVHIPHFNSIFNYLEMPELTPILRTLIEQSSLPVKAIETRFAVDSTGFSTCRFVRWYDAKYGQEMEQHEWIKAHIMCGVITNIVTSVEITGGYAGDSPQFKPLLETTARNFPISEVSADKAYSSRENLELVDAHNGTPYIPFKVNTTARHLHDRSAGLWDKLYHFYHFHRETFLEHYHRRSLSESTFSMIKAKFGDALRSKTDTALVNELLCKVLCHNICVLIQSMYELGVPICFES